MNGIMRDLYMLRLRGTCRSRIIISYSFQQALTLVSHALHIQKLECPDDVRQLLGIFLLLHDTNQFLEEQQHDMFVHPVVRYGNGLF